jgi:uncharacterized membrane protein YtjA (UPF0391 family)
MVVAAIIGFLGLGFGQIEISKIIFYVFSFSFIISFLLERRKKGKGYY